MHHKTQNIPAPRFPGLLRILLPALLLIPVLFQPPCAAPQESFAGMSEREYALLTLTAPDATFLDSEIERLSGESGGRAGGEAARALGMLHIARYIRSENKRDAFRALELFENLPARTPLQLAYAGMAHAFVARIRTIFGVGHLESMQEAMRAIPEDYPDYLVRFLRGNTLLQVGRGLPSVFSIKEIKEEAVLVGTADLEYVLETARDPENRVPEAFSVQARKVLSE